MPTGRMHWSTLLRSRAIENQCFVIAAAQVGKHNDKRKSYGHSLAVDPLGKVVADGGGYGTGDEEDVGEEVKNINIYVDLDVGMTGEVREGLQVERHRREGDIGSAVNIVE